MAKQCRFLSDIGAYRGMAPLLLMTAVSYLDMPYRVPNLKCDGYLIYTNNAPMPVGNGDPGSLPYGQPTIPI